MSKKTLALVLLGIAALAVAVLLLREGEKRSEGLALGAIMPLTGDLAAYGTPVKAGMEFALNEINASGGIAGESVTIVFEDDGGNPSQAISAFRKLVDSDGVPMVLGPLTSTASLATAPVAQETRRVQLSTIAGTTKLSQAGDYVFRLFPSDEFQGAYLGRVARETFGSARAAIVYVNNAYGDAVRRVVRESYEQLGGEIIAEESVEEGGTDFNAQVAKIRALAPDLVFGLLYYNEGSQFLIQSYQQGLDVVVLGGDAWFGPVAELAGEAAKLLVFSSVAFGPEHVASSKMQEFISDFRSAAGREPDSYAATGYDAVYSAKKAIELGGNSPAGIRDALHKVEFEGALGHIKFDENGDNIGAEFALFQIRGGTTVPFSSDRETEDEKKKAV